MSQKESLLIANSRYKVLIFLVLILASCQDLDRTEKPKDLIPEDKMVDVLTELSLLNAARNFNKFKLEKTGIEPESYIYEKFGIDSLQFERSNAWYSEQYTVYEGIYDSVKVRVQLMKTRLDSIMERERKIEDSIKLAQKDSLKQLRDSLKNPADSIKKPDSLLVNKKVKVVDSLLAPPVQMEKKDGGNG